jgi:ubiquinone/menaquinone biosynthesis C-methylase UbiE
VDTVLDAIQQAAVTADDVFVDVGAGAGRAALLAHLKTGAGCIGLEIQPALARAAQGRADWLGLTRLRFVAADASDMIRFVPVGTVFFLYCPFGADRLRRFLDRLEDRARARQIRVCCVDMPPLERPWLARLPSASARIDVYQSTLLPAAKMPCGKDAS